MLHVAIGHSADIDSADAAVELLQTCGRQLGGRTPTAGVLFAALDHDHAAILGRIMATYPDLDLVGCTTDGEVSSAGGFAEDSLTLMLMAPEAAEITAGLGEGVRADPAGATRRAVEMARAKASGAPKLCIATPEGLGVRTAAVLQGLADALGSGVPICGGMAADQLRFQQTFQFYKTQVYSDAVPVLLFSGPVRVSCAVASGWSPIGERHRVTAAHDNVVVSIDGEPASNLYTHYIKEHSVHYPLAVYAEGSEAYYLSTPAGFDGGTIVCQNVVPEGAEVQLAEATRDEIIGGAAESVRRALEAYPGLPEAGLLFSCAGRRAALGTRTHEEYEHLARLTDQALPLCGFYTYGEICPLPDGAGTQSHNCTFVTVLVGEEHA